MTRKITKAVFPVAGRGTRFMPATTAVPKELIPVLDTPLLQYAVEEAIQAGAKDLIFVSSREKPAIEQHFAQFSGVNFHVVYQDEPKGLGHAILCARLHVQDEDFAVILPDDFIMTEGDNVLQQMAGQDSDVVIAAMDVPEEDVSKYGIISGQDNGNAIKLEKLVEKPSVKDAPSRTAIVGRYVLPARVFEHLQDISDSHDGQGEIQLTEALDRFAAEGKALGYRFEGRRFDCGQVHGWLQANIEMGLKRDDTKKVLEDYMRGIAV